MKIRIRLIIQPRWHWVLVESIWWSKVVDNTDESFLLLVIHNFSWKSSFLLILNSKPRLIWTSFWLGKSQKLVKWNLEMLEYIFKKLKKFGRNFKVTRKNFFGGGRGYFFPCKKNYWHLTRPFPHQKNSS